MHLNICKVRYHYWLIFLLKILHYVQHSMPGKILPQIRYENVFLLRVKNNVDKASTRKLVSGIIFDIWVFHHQFCARLRVQLLGSPYNIWKLFHFSEEFAGKTLLIPWIISPFLLIILKKKHTPKTQMCKSKFQWPSTSKTDLV